MVYQPRSARDELRAQHEILKDESEWHDKYATLAWSINKHSAMFWLLLAATSFFALLNGYYGFTSSLSSGIPTAIAIAGIYTVIEYTVPMSAHMISYGDKETAGRWVVRGPGFLAFLAAVLFSLLILQMKFTSGADEEAARRESAALVRDTQSSTAKGAAASIQELRAKVGSTSPDTYQLQYQQVMNTPVQGQKTLYDTTSGCSRPKTSREKDLCGKWQDLRQKQQDALELRRLQATQEKAITNLQTDNKFGVAGKSSNAAEKALAQWLNVPVETVETFRPSIIAALAAFITHMLWLAYSAQSNAAIEKMRKAHYAKAQTSRSLTLAERYEQEDREEAERAERRRIAETQQEFHSKRGTPRRVAEALSESPLGDQGLATQVQEFYNERCILDADFEMSIGPLHDDYHKWCYEKSVRPLGISEFKRVTRALNFTISERGHVLGAALKA